jgi:hypothetical protein
VTVNPSLAEANAPAAAENRERDHEDEQEHFAHRPGDFLELRCALGLDLLVGALRPVCLALSRGVASGRGRRDVGGRAERRLRALGVRLDQFVRFTTVTGLGSRSRPIARSRLRFCDCVTRTRRARAAPAQCPRGAASTNR